MRVKGPFAVRRFVETGVHWLKGCAASVLITTLYVQPKTPSVALTTRLVALLTLVLRIFGPVMRLSVRLW